MPTIVNPVNVSLDSGAGIVLTEGGNFVGSWSTQLISIILAAALFGILLIVMVICFVWYKQTHRSSVGGETISGTSAPYETGSDMIKDSSCRNAKDEDRRWKAEDNPHNRWHKLSFSEGDDRDQNEANFHKEQLLRKGSVSE